ncbi:MAG: cysteine desulfurase family protein [Chlamydiota bacterium]
MERIYLDNNASTPLDPDVYRVTCSALQELYGNPSSSHHEGQAARKKLSEARHLVAEYLGASSSQIIFTSGGTEGLNMALRGIAEKYPGGHIITSSAEHAAVYETVRFLENKGWEASFLEAGPKGAISADDVEEAIKPNTAMIAVMAVNNETGVKTDLEGVAALAQARNILLVVDGVAWMGKEPLNIPEGVSAIAFSGHKIHAPKGIGVLWVAPKLTIPPMLLGGGQEYGQRSGTENLPSIIGLAEAVKVLLHNEKFYQQHILGLRQHFERLLRQNIPSAIIHGQGPRTTNTTNVAFPGVEAEMLLMRLDLVGISASYGSACSSGALEPSRALLSMGIPSKIARSSLRFSFSRMNSIAEVEKAVDIITALVDALSL